MGMCSICLLLSGLLAFVHGNPLLLFANRKDIRLVNPQNEDTTIVVSNLDDAAAVDFLYSDGLIFWTDINLETIKRIKINKTHSDKEIISTGLVSPDGLACDWVGRKLYWTDSETNRIEVSELDGSNRKVLYWQNLDQPRALALDPFNGYMYWTDWGETPKIEKAGMDGNLATRTVLVNSSIDWPNGITLDYGDSRIYWVDAKNHYIHSVNFDGSGRRVIIDTNLPHPFALTLYNDTLYWTDWQTKSIHSCNKLTGSDIRDVLTDIHSPMDIHVYTSQRQQMGTNPCGSNNGGCSHLCLMSPVKPFYKCACATGVPLLDDGKTCAEGAEEILLLARRTDLRRISLDTPDYTDVVLQLDDIRHAIAIDYDPVEGHVYWTDDEVRAIQRAYLNGTGQMVIANTEVDHPDGIAVDWVARNLYWTDTGTDRIEVARLNGTYRRVLISEDLDEPRAICLDPVAGHMYWTDWGKKPKIERANLDGSDRVILVNTSLGWPNGIAIDFQDRKLFWGDANTDRIEVANLDGTGRRVLLNKDSEELPHIFGFTVLGDYIYWTDWQRRSIERIRKNTGGERTVIVDQLPDLMGLKAVNVHKAEGTNGCVPDNFGCSHLCLNRPEPKGPVCACPMGMELVSSGKKCIVPEAFLLFTREEDIHRMSLETDHRIVQIPIKGVMKAMSIDFDINDKRIYWTDGMLKTISRAYMNGSSVEVVVQFGIEYPEGIAVDWIAHNIYWADTGSRRIEVARLDGSSRRVLIWENLTHPRALALDPPSGHMYWTDWSDPPRLERANLDGSNRSVLISNLGRMTGLTIDYPLKKLYWADIDEHVIEASDLEGRNRHRVLGPDSDLPNPMALTQYQDFLYWSDWERRTIERANKTAGTNRTTVQGEIDKVMDILIFHQSRQSGWNMCNVNNGGCSHLCLATPYRSGENNSHHCACPTHYILNSSRTCKAPESFLLFSQKNDISRLVFEVKDSVNGTPDVVLPIPGLRNIKAIDYDPLDRFIYWIGGKHKSIKRARDDGTESSTVMFVGNDGQVEPFDLAVEPYSRMIFWTCAKNNVINVTRIDGKPVGVVMSKEEQEPRYIVLNALTGHMYWVNTYESSSIEKAALDGTDHVVLFDSELEKPGPLAIDAPNGMLYWADSDSKRLECSDLSGGNRRTLVDNDIGSVKGLAVFNDYLYWADRGQELIGRVDLKRSGRKITWVLGRVKMLSDLVSALHVDQLDTKKHPCAKNNGNCSHICYEKFGSAHCSCPNHLVLKLNGKVCVDKTTCSPDQFTCTKGDTHCIPYAWRCDGSAECTDNSDEMNCPVCGPTEFKCEDGTCISESKVCDGIFDCTNKEDEHSCCEISTQIRCGRSKKCYDRSKRCNSIKDCDDGSDELRCPVVREKADSQPHNTAHYTIAIVMGVISLVIVLAVIFACRRKSPNSPFDDRDIIKLTEPLNPLSGQNTTPPNTLPTRSKTHSSGGVPSLSLGSGSQPLYDRNHVTGASSSSSAVTQYPKETLNPPPSPVTDRSVCAGEFYEYSSNSPSTVRSRQYKPRHIPPPPTTPCSTDVCEDSEPYYRKKFYSNSVLELNYDSDPYPPPPTPHSRFSDELSCPPSPSTERSFFNPYPPPPSPVGNSDC